MLKGTKRIIKDETGIFTLLAVIFIAFCLMPISLFAIEVSRNANARSEAQIAVDTIALTIANESRKNVEVFRTYLEPCRLQSYEGKEYFIDYVGDGDAQSYADSIFDKNDYHYIDSFKISNIDITEEYQRTSNLEQRIPSSTKQQKHYPTIKVEADFYYEPMFAWIMGDTVKVSKTSQTFKFFDPKPYRVERTLNTSCPPPPPPPKTEVPKKAGKNTGVTGSGKK